MPLAAPYSMLTCGTTKQRDALVAAGGLIACGAQSTGTAPRLPAVMSGSARPATSTYRPYVPAQRSPSLQTAPVRIDTWTRVHVLTRTSALSTPTTTSRLRCNGSGATERTECRKAGSVERTSAESVERTSAGSVRFVKHVTVVQRRSAVSRRCGGRGTAVCGCGGLVCGGRAEPQAVNRSRHRLPEAEVRACRLRAGVRISGAESGTVGRSVSARPASRANSRARAASVPNGAVLRAGCVQLAVWRVVHAVNWPVVALVELCVECTGAAVR